MQFVQLAGILTVVNSLVCAAWYVWGQSRPLAGGPGIVLGVAVLAGVLLTFGDKLFHRSIRPSKELILVQHAGTAPGAQSSSDAGELPKPSEVPTRADDSLKADSPLADRAERLEELFTKMVVGLEQGDYAEGFAAAREAVQLHEESEAHSPGRRVPNSDYRPEWIASIYTVAAELAQLNRQHTTAVRWAERAVDLAPTAERHALLVVALLHDKRRDDAASIVRDIIERGDEDSERFQKILRENGVLKQAMAEMSVP